MNDDIDAKFRDIFRTGEVVEVKATTVRVEFKDADNMVSGELQVIKQKTRDDKDYWMPDVGELVACIFLGNGPSAGFVLGAVYNNEDKPPENSEGKWVKEFRDGTRFEYDREGRKLDLTIKGDVVLHIDKDRTTAIDGKENIEAKGDINLKSGGKINAEASEANIECSAVNLGAGASFAVVHSASPCPIFGVCHLNPSLVTKTA